jgi:hypothetical protein
MIPSGFIQTRSFPNFDPLTFFSPRRRRQRAEAVHGGGDQVGSLRPKGRISLPNDEPSRPRSMGTYDARFVCLVLS